ncbi:MAG: 3-deoxy-7-phosphoheptulonate synthase class II [Sandaracinaceae bacterium]|nr:3-deoxy-7-phosphoheptulonate synthase class II [Sandaracinaceae bacterium]
MSWSPDSWKSKPAAQSPKYEDPAALEAAVARLRSLPPLVTSWEIDRLKRNLAEAQEGRRLVLQGGDCAETLADCSSATITGKLKILLQMSLVLVHGSRKPVVRIGRFAGQYAKPRSSPTETRVLDGERVELPSYFGDIVNHAEFTPQARAADPRLLLDAYQHASLTLNFIRSLTAGGFADLHHPEYWDLSFLHHASLPEALRAEYQRTSEQLASALRFMEALGETSIDELTRVEFFTSHEGLSLHYESAQTRAVPRRKGYWDLTTHMPWIGERTRQIDGAHVELFRGVQNPVGVKIGPSIDPQELLRLIDALNPEDEPGKLVLITRMGAGKVADRLPPLVEAVARAGRRVLWICDPMHGNTQVTAGGIKTRSFDDILREVEASMDVHASIGTVFGGVHFEMTGEDVTECLGGAAGITEADLTTNYATACDPRLNYRQALEMAFSITRRLRPR